LQYRALNGNQQAVANALTRYFNSTGGIPLSFFTVSPGGLTQIDGEAATGAEGAAFRLTTQFLNLMLDPFVDGRSEPFGSGGQGLGFAPDAQAALPPDVALAYAGVLKAPPLRFAPHWSAWGGAYGGDSSVSGDPVAGSSNLSAQTLGMAGGMDYHASPDTTLGFALAGGGTNWGLSGGLGGGRSDALQAGGYGITHAGEAYLAGAASFTNHWFATNRTALGDQLTGRFQGQSYGARLESGYRFAVLPWLGVTPYAAAQGQKFATAAFGETDVTGGGFGLDYASMHAIDVRGELGLRLDDPTLFAGMPLILRSRVAIAHDTVGNPALGAVFEALPGASFIVEGAPIPKNSALASAGAQLFITPQMSLLAKFDGEFARGAQSYAGSGTLRYAWGRTP
jgi:outer membrane autotransporter protein